MQELSEQELNDLGNNFIRTQLATVQGAALPFPYGGKVRQIQVDLNPTSHANLWYFSRKMSMRRLMHKI